MKGLPKPLQEAARRRIVAKYRDLDPAAIAAHLGVSVVTVRRDLAAIATGISVARKSDD